MGQYKQILSTILREKIQLTKNKLPFDEIGEFGSGEGFEYNKVLVSFSGKDGGPLRGVRVWFSGEDEKFNDGKDLIEDSTEIFLTENGELIRFQRVDSTRYFFDAEEKRDASKNKVEFHRKIAENQSFEDDLDLAAIIFNIFHQLMSAEEDMEKQAVLQAETSGFYKEYISSRKLLIQYRK